jgi:FkbM family methyltransferase
VDLKHQVRRSLSTSGTVYSLAAMVETLGRYLLARPVDADHHIWRRLENPLTLVDVGANRGQTALSFASVSRLPHSIVSFEANQHNEPYLRLVRRVLGDRFDYHMCGLGNASGSQAFFVPVQAGRRLTGEGSFDAHNVERASRRFGSDYTVVEEEFDLRRLDSFALEPDIVKIDVQGLELQVVEGMGEMLDRRPLLMIEANDHTDGALRRLLGAYGYRSFRRAPGENLLAEPGPDDTPLNWFYAAPATMRRFPQLFERHRERR